MKKIKLLATAFAATAFSMGSVNAAESTGMEKCKVVDENGKGLILEHRGSCTTATHSCAGQNVAGDPDAWIMVPAGECEKINKGNFSGVSGDIKEKIDMRVTEKAQEQEKNPEQTESKG